jgi:hypothetical protein
MQQQTNSKTSGNARCGHETRYGDLRDMGARSEGNSDG